MRATASCIRQFVEACVDDFQEVEIAIDVVIVVGQRAADIRGGRAKHYIGGLCVGRRACSCLGIYNGDLIYCGVDACRR